MHDGNEDDRLLQLTKRRQELLYKISQYDSQLMSSSKAQQKAHRLMRQARSFRTWRFLRR